LYLFPLSLSPPFRHVWCLQFLNLYGIQKHKLIFLSFPLSLTHKLLFRSQHFTFTNSLSMSFNQWPLVSCSLGPCGLMPFCTFTYILTGFWGKAEITVCAQSVFSRSLHYSVSPSGGLHISQEYDRMGETVSYFFWVLCTYICFTRGLLSTYQMLDMFLPGRKGTAKANKQHLCTGGNLGGRGGDKR
jgi:hypothetical protein